MTNVVAPAGVYRSLHENRALILAVYALAGTVALFPLLSVSIPPLIDYPNHLARMHILAFLDSVPALRQSYRVDWSIVPNLAMDIVVPPLARLTGVFMAGKLFVAAAMILPVAGVAALRRVLHGRAGLWPAVGFLFVYNHVLIWGFLNYLFTIGLYFLAFAAWIATQRWSGWARVALFSAIATGLYIGHFFAFAVYGLTVTGFELGRWIRARNASRGNSVAGTLRHGAVAFGQFAVPAALWFMAPASNARVITIYGDSHAKLVAIWSPTLAYGGLLDALALLFPAALVVWGVVAGGITLASALRYPLAFLALAAVLMPVVLLGTWGADFRLPFVVVLLSIAGIRWRLRRHRLALVLTALGALLFSARVLSIAEIWQGYDREFAEFRAAAGDLEEGALVLSVRSFRPGSPPLYSRRMRDNAYLHLPALLVIDRAIFTPLLFTNPAAQPVRVVDARAALDVPFAEIPTPEHLRQGADPRRAAILAETAPAGSAAAYWAFWPDHYRYVVAMHFGTPENPVPEWLTLHAQGSFFSIYEVSRRVPE